MFLSFDNTTIDEKHMITIDATITIIIRSGLGTKSTFSKRENTPLITIFTKTVVDKPTMSPKTTLSTTIIRISVVSVAPITSNIPNSLSFRKYNHSNC